MGAGLHGRKGINPVISYQMYRTFALPKMIYGLETLQLSQKDVRSLETYEARTLKQIQSLPDRCANIAAYIFLGVIPFSLHIDTRKSTFFGSITRQIGTAEHEIARRQLAIKDTSSHSWFVHIRQLLQKYDLPSAFDLMRDPPSKQHWKTQVQRNIYQYWADHVEAELMGKSSLRMLHAERGSSQKPHQVWATIPCNTRAVLEASIKARILTGTYTLQSNRHKFNQFAVSPTCTLCKLAPEDRTHFILHCHSLQSSRTQYLPRVELAIRASNNDRCVTDMILRNDELLLQCIVDCSADRITNVLKENAEIRAEIERSSRILIFNLHQARKAIISE